MVERTERLRRLVKLQEQIKAVHEMRHAQHLSDATAARQEAAELLDALNAASPLPGIFPDLYNKRISTAFSREARSNAKAQAEAGRVAAETARTNMVVRSYQEASRGDERQQAEKEQLESLERVQPGHK